MADPQHVEELDGFDRFTVGAYRTGLAVSALGLIAATAVQVGLALGYDVSIAVRPVWVIVTAGAALSIQHVHIYAKHVRWVIGVSGWLGVVLQLAAVPLPETAAWWFFHAGLGFVFVSLSGFALKEQFCFRLPALNLVPVLLAGSLVPLLGGWSWPAAALLGGAASIYAILAVAKLRMPQHYDIGDKSRYQI